MKGPAVGQAFHFLMGQEANCSAAVGLLKPAVLPADLPEVVRADSGLAGWALRCPVADRPPRAERRKLLAQCLQFPWQRQ